MFEINNQYTLMKRRIDTEVLRMFFDGALKETVDALPIKIIPRGREPNRCCIYKERAMVRYRIMALLGVDIDRFDDEMKSLGSYAREALDSDPSPMPTLTTIPPGCSSCPPDRYRITDACRGCLARPCLANCPKDAIMFVNGQAHIMEDRCVRCGKCLEMCPFHSVVHIPVPCEEACPVDAIKKDGDGCVRIDHQKCISCGRCARSCPFGAIVERSGLISVVKMLVSGEPVTAMVAPSIQGQFPGSLEQIKASLLSVGFSEVVEVAEGAQITSIHEADGLEGRMTENRGYMTTSCCSAYMELVDRHLPFLKDRRSTALSPMCYTAKLCSERYPGSKRVFIGPCLAKKVEAARTKNIDGVISFSELAALLVAKGIDVREMDGVPMGDVASFEDCREFACSKGVSDSVLRHIAQPDMVRAMHIDGIDRKMVKTLKIWEKHPPETDLVEVMCCEGGCLAGPGVLVNPKLAQRLRQGTNVTKIGFATFKR